MDGITFTRRLDEPRPYYISDDGLWRIQRQSRTAWSVTSDHFSVDETRSTFTESKRFADTYVLPLPDPSQPQKVADSEPFDFTAIDAAADDVDRKSRHLAFATSALATQVDAARQAGVSWTTIGVHLGLSKQGAQQRFGAKS